MSIDTRLQLITSGDMSGNITSTAVTSVTDSAMVEFAIVTGTPTGSLAVQGSVSETNYRALPLSGVDGTVSESITISGAAATHLVRVTDVRDIVRLRLVYTATSGTGTADAWISQ